MKKVYYIAVIIDGRAEDVISYTSEKRYSSEKEMELVIKFINQQVCNIKAVEINHRKASITSDKGTVYAVSYSKITLWNESELEG